MAPEAQQFWECTASTATFLGRVAGQERRMVNAKEWSKNLFCKLPGRHSWELPHYLQVSCASTEKCWCVAMTEPLFPAPTGVAWETQGREETERLKVRKHISYLRGIYTTNIQRLSRYCLNLIKIHLGESIYKWIFVVARNNSCD